MKSINIDTIKKIVFMILKIGIAYFFIIGIFSFQILNTKNESVLAFTLNQAQQSLVEHSFYEMVLTGVTFFTGVVYLVKRALNKRKINKQKGGAKYVV